MEGKTITLTYFGIEGVAEKIRLALEIGGREYTDERVSFDQWSAMKPTTKYGQLPMMKIGDDEPFAQSGAMLRYCGKHVGLYPDEHLLRIEELIGLEEDLGKAVTPSMYIGMRPQMFGYPEDMPKEEKTKIQLALREKLIAPEGDLTRMLGYLEKHLDGYGPFFCGEKPTIADCQIIQRLRHLSKGVLDGIPATIIDGFPKLKKFYTDFHEIPQVKAYYQKLAEASASK